MPGVVYYCASSLDGYIAAADDNLDWLTGYEGSFDGDGAVPMEGSYDEFYAGVGSLVMGSATYEFLQDHFDSDDSWPYKGKPTWVLTTRELEPFEGEGVDIRFAQGSVPDLAPEMIEAAGEGQLWVVGGGQLVSDFAAAGLLDTVIVTVVPVVLGTGKPLFGEPLPGGPMQPLHLTGTRAFDNGMVEVSYAVIR